MQTKTAKLTKTTFDGICATQAAGEKPDSKRHEDLKMKLKLKPKDIRSEDFKT